MDTLQAEPETASATERAILADVRARFEATENPRLRQLILGLIDHLHAFVRRAESHVVGVGIFHELPRPRRRGHEGRPE